MIPLSLLLRKVKASLNGIGRNFNLIIFFSWTTSNSLEKVLAQIERLVQTVFIFSEDSGMEFGLRKCGVVILKKGKLVKFDEIHLPNQEIMKEVDEN